MRALVALPLVVMACDASMYSETVEVVLQADTQEEQRDNFPLVLAAWSDKEANQVVGYQTLCEPTGTDLVVRLQTAVSDGSCGKPVGHAAIAHWAIDDGASCVSVVDDGVLDPQASDPTADLGNVEEWLRAAESDDFDDVACVARVTL
jgi:hypothetical protein